MEEDLCFLRGLVPWVPEEVVAFVYTHHCNGHRVSTTEHKNIEIGGLQIKGTQSKQAIIEWENSGDAGEERQDTEGSTFGPT
jgi:hypothetical protein